VELHLHNTIRIHEKLFNYVRSQILPYTLDKQLLLSKHHHAQEHSTYSYIAVMKCMYESHAQKMTKMCFLGSLKQIFCPCFFDNMNYICSKKRGKDAIRGDTSLIV